MTGVENPFRMNIRLSRLKHNSYRLAGMFIAFR